MAVSKRHVAAFMCAMELDEEEDHDDETLATVFMAQVSKEFMRGTRTRIKRYVEDVIPNYSNEEFRRLFRMSRATFHSIVQLLDQCPELVVEGSGGREPITVEKQLYVTLWYLGGSDSISRIADRFGISESSVIMSRNRVMDGILNNLKSKIITWPKQEEMQGTVENFQRRNGFPGILGALDGTHIQIKAPKENPQSYVNRKKYHSLQLQAVCDSDMIFLDCFAGYPGSCHDARVLRNSSMWENGLQMCNGNHIIADGAYPLRRWLLTPYRDNGHLNDEQKNFNYKLSANRVVIERAFGLLKGRFRRLQYVDTQHIKTAVEVIMASCVLHNICMMHHEDIDFIDIDVDGAVVGRAICIQENEAEGVLKRNMLARRLYRI